MIKLLIVDDHAVIREGLKKILAPEPEFQVVDTASDAEEALDFISKIIVDVIILDISMPGRSGLDIIKDIKTIQPAVKIIMLTMHKEAQMAMKAFLSGASGYLTKELVSEEIIKAIQLVCSGKRYTYPGFEEKLLMMLTEPPPEILYNTLSNREFEVLRLIIAGKSINDIADILEINNRTVSTYKRRILAKMKMIFDIDLIKYFLENKILN